MKKRIKIKGMSCGHCVNAVEKTLGHIKGVSSITVSLEENKAYVEVSDFVSNEALKSAIEDAGYEVLEID